MFNNNEAEQGIIGGILFDNSAMARVLKNIESPQDFFNANYQTIFKSMCELHQKGSTIDMITLRELDGSLSLDILGEALENFPSSANVGIYSKVVHEHSLRRTLCTRLLEIKDACLQGEDIAVLSSDLEGLVTNLVSSCTDVVKAKVFGKEVLTKFGKRIESAELGLPASGITTGFSVLDKTTGGYYRKELFVVGARPSVGKTYFMVNSAIKAVQSNLRVGIWSLEMAGDSISERFACNLEGLDGEVIRTGIFYGRHDKEDYSTRLAKGLGTLANSPIWFYDKSPNIDRVIESMRNAKTKHNLDIIFIDHLQEITASSQDSKLAYHQQVGNSVKKIRDFGKSTNTAVVLFVQINRSSESSTRPQLSNLKDSGRIEELSDEVLILHRDFVKEESKNIIEAYLAKNRHGERGQFLIEFKPEISKLEEIKKPRRDWRDEE